MSVSVKPQGALKARSGKESPQGPVPRTDGEIPVGAQNLKNGAILNQAAMPADGKAPAPGAIL